MINYSKCLYQFGEFTIDTQEQLLHYNGEIVPMSPKVFDLLYIFVTHYGVLLDKETLMTMMWADSFVEESNLSYTISILRKVLSEHDASHKYIETFPRRGYRFVVEVKKIEEPESEQEQVAAAEQSLTVEKNEARQLARKLPAPFFSRYWKAGLAIAGLAILGSGVWLGAARKTNLSAMAQSNSLSTASHEVSAVRSIAVLPFKKLTSNADDEYLGVGIADTLINRLSSLRQMQVRPISAVLAYADPKQDVLAAGREQRVDAVIEGNVQHAGKQLRVSVRMLRVSDGMLLWAENYDFAWQDIFTTQDAIADHVVKTLALKLNGTEQAGLRKKPLTKNPEALQSYLKARFIFNKHESQKFTAALALFQDAIDRDPEFAWAYEGFAVTYLALGYEGFLPPEEAYEKAKAAVSKAIAIDPDFAAAYALLGFMESDINNSEKYCQRALDLDANNYEAHLNWGITLLAKGNFSEGEKQIRICLELNPLSLEAQTLLAVTFYYSHQFEKAIVQTDYVQEIESAYSVAHIVKGDALVQLGKYQAAIAEYKFAFQLTPETQNQDDQVAAVLALSGHRDEALKTLAFLKAEAKKSYVPAFNLARICIALGDKEQALAYLQKADEEHAGEMKFIKVDPRFASLHNEPQFQAILRGMNLVP